MALSFLYNEVDLNYVDKFTVGIWEYEDDPVYAEGGDSKGGANTLAPVADSGNDSYWGINNNLRAIGGAIFDLDAALAALDAAYQAHNHDSLYYRKTEFTDVGGIVNPSKPVILPATGIIPTTMLPPSVIGTATQYEFNIMAGAWGAGSTAEYEDYAVNEGTRPVNWFSGTVDEYVDGIEIIVPFTADPAGILTIAYRIFSAANVASPNNYVKFEFSYAAIGNLEDGDKDYTAYAAQTYYIPEDTDDINISTNMSMATLGISPGDTLRLKVKRITYLSGNTDVGLTNTNLFFTR